MKITSFNPLIVTKDAEATIALFEAMGFERRHKKTGINGADNITSVRMRYTGEDGKVFHVDIAESPRVPNDMMSIRMNVGDFDEAYRMLEEKGFTNAQGDWITNTGTSKSTMMVSPSGFSISVTEHIKDKKQDTSVKDFYKKVDQTKLKEALSSDTPEALKNAAKDAGFELSDEQLEYIAGGYAPQSDHDSSTTSE